MNPGSIVKATVQSVEPYGIFLRHNEDVILVLIPEVVWIPSSVRDCREFTRPGESFAVKILRYVPECGHYLGSLKQTQPDDDPWRNSDEFKVGSQWEGRVTHVIRHQSGHAVSGYIVGILPGVEGFLPLPENFGVLTVGESIDVTIEKIDVSDQRILFARWAQDNSIPEGE